MNPLLPELVPLRGTEHLVPIPRPRLLLRPAAFLKLTYLCHAAETEIGGFGLSTAADPLTIEDVLIVRQRNSVVTVEFDDDAVADLVDEMVDQGVPPHRCTRVWVHTHPGSSATPSGVDERTFARSFAGADFSVMLILARGGAFYARLQVTGTVKASMEIPVHVDWASLPQWLDAGHPQLPQLVQGWQRELAELVRPDPVSLGGLGGALGGALHASDFTSARYDLELDDRDWLALGELDPRLDPELEDRLDEPFGEPFEETLEETEVADVRRYRR